VADDRERRRRRRFAEERERSTMDLGGW